MKNYGSAPNRLGLTPDEYHKLIESGQKRCAGCKTWHPRSEFARDRSASDGLQGRCNDYLLRTSKTTRTHRPRVECPDCKHVYAQRGDGAPYQHRCEKETDHGD